MKIRQWLAWAFLIIAGAGFAICFTFSFSSPHLTQMQVFLEVWPLELISVLLAGIACWMLTE